MQRNCPRCRTLLNVPDGVAQTKCPNCGKRFSTSQVQVMYGLVVKLGLVGFVPFLLLLGLFHH